MKIYNDYEVHITVEPKVTHRKYEIDNLCDFWKKNI